MANYLSPASFHQFIDANGNPYSGAKLFTYAVGSSTKVTTYKDEAGSSAHANPIVLNTKGQPADGSGVAYPIWQIGSTAVKYVLAPSTDTDPPASAIATWDNIDGINDTTITVDQWVAGATPSYVSATSLTLVGDQTSTYHVGRRIKTTNSGGTIYSTITVSAYTSLTTLTVVNDSGSLDSGLSAISYALISASNTTVPGVEISGTTWTHQGILVNEKIVKWAKGADVASAGAITLGTDGNYFDITGTTTITSIGTLGVGTVVKLHFDGALTLTHHATDLILPGSTNITTIAGDEAEFVEYATGDWRLTNYQTAKGVIATASGTAATYLAIATFSATQNVYVGDTVIVNYKATGVMNGTSAFLEEITIGESGAGTCVLQFYPSQACLIQFSSTASHGSGATVTNSYTLAFKVITAGTLIAMAGTGVSESGTAPTVKASYIYTEIVRH